jgi:tetratricopeptide (TPR) repeat protein
VKLRRLANTTAAACAIFFIASCASNSTADSQKLSQSAAEKSAQSLSSRAVAAYNKGDLVAAAAGFEAAAHIYESLALIEPQAQARLSAARVHAEQEGASAAAVLMVQRVLQDEAQLSSATRVTAHGRAAALHLVANNASAAQQHLQSATTACASTCAQAAALQVLAARVALAQNKADIAISLVTPVLADALERPNALRTRAAAYAALNQHRQALADATQALALDQAAGQAHRVETDLRLMAAAHQALGNAAEASRLEALATRSEQAQERVRRGLP